MVTGGFSGASWSAHWVALQSWWATWRWLFTISRWQVCSSRSVPGYRTGWRKGGPCLQPLFRAGSCWEELSNQDRWNVAMFLACCSCAWQFFCVMGLDGCGCSPCVTRYSYPSTGAVTLTTRMGKMWRGLGSAQQRESWIMMMTPWSWSFLQVGVGFVLGRTFSAFLIAAALTCSVGHRSKRFPLVRENFTSKCLWDFVLAFHYFHYQVVLLLQH